MGRTPRADEAGGIYHALNRGNARHDHFFKDADFVVRLANFSGAAQLVREAES